MVEINVAHDVDQNHASEMLTEGATATATATPKRRKMARQSRTPRPCAAKCTQFSPATPVDRLRVNSKLNVLNNLILIKG